MKHFHFTLSALRRLRRAGLPASDWIAALPAAMLASATLALQKSTPSGVDNDRLQPVFVLGHWRSGTTWLHELLSLNPAFSAPNVYECLYPHHFALTEASLSRTGGLRRARPRPMDGMPVALDSPQEDEFALMSLGAVSMYRWMILPSQFERCLADLDARNWSPADTLEWTLAFRTFLAGVSGQRPGRLLLLKSPTHMFRIPLLRTLFPHARFVHITRDPRHVFVSSTKLWNDMFALHATQPYGRVDVPECVMRIGELQERIALPEISRLPVDVCHRVRYEDLVAQPLPTLEALHRQLDLPWTVDDEQRVVHYLRERAEHRATSGAKPLSSDVEAALRHRWPGAFST